MNSFLVILAIISILFTAVGQLLLKIGANSPNVNRRIPQSLKPYLNQYTIPGYGLLFIVTILSIYILEDMPLKVFFPLFISGNLIAIAVLSHFILHESFTNRKIMGICLIISGILIFSS
jgi:multidrug transporter EmrE-like cation transporter